MISEAAAVDIIGIWNVIDRDVLALRWCERPSPLPEASILAVSGSDGDGEINGSLERFCAGSSGHSRLVWLFNFHTLVQQIQINTQNMKTPVEQVLAFQTLFSYIAAGSSFDTFRVSSLKERPVTSLVYANRALGVPVGRNRSQASVRNLL